MGMMTVGCTADVMAAASTPSPRTTTCRFSGLRIYPGKGIIYVRVDGQVRAFCVAAHMYSGPSHGTPPQQWLFLNRKVKSLYNQRKRPAKLAWTTTYRKMHRKVGIISLSVRSALFGEEVCSLVTPPTASQDQEQQVARKKRRSQNKQTVRAIAGASLEVINKRRTERPEQRKASREAALRYACIDNP